MDTQITRIDALAKLYADYGLVDKDYYNTGSYEIITRTGIEKIQAKCNIIVTYDLVYNSMNCTHIIVKAFGVDSNDNQMQSYGEVNPQNNWSSYPVAVAEKRALSRVVLKLSGFYKINDVISEDELEGKEGDSKRNEMIAKDSTQKAMKKVLRPK